MNVKYLKHLYTKNLVSLLGTTILAPIGFRKNFNKLLKYTSYRTVSYMKKFSELPSVVLTDK